MLNFLFKKEKLMPLLFSASNVLKNDLRLIFRDWQNIPIQMSRQVQLIDNYYQSEHKIILGSAA